MEPVQKTAYERDSRFDRRL